MEPLAGDSHEFGATPREELIEEILRLRADLQRREDEARATAKRKTRLGVFMARVGLRTFTGAQLYEKGVEAWDAWSAWLRSGVTGAWPEPPTRDFVAALLARFTRIGIIFLVFAALPVVVTMLQLLVLSRQNELIRQQTELAESARRSALVFEQSSILDEIDEELDSFAVQSGDSTKVRLTPRLEGRIVALSRSLRPYRYLDGDRLTEEPRSPERGQLLMALANSQIDLSLILHDADFSFADLPGTTLIDVDLGRTVSARRVAAGSLVGANFRSSYFNSVSFRGADLSSSQFHRSLLFGMNFESSNLDSADFTGAHISDADFTSANLFGAHFTGATITSSKFDSVNVSETDFKNAALRDVRFVPQRESPDGLRAQARQLCRARYMGNSQFSSALLTEMRTDDSCARKLLGAIAIQ